MLRTIFVSLVLTCGLIAQSGSPTDTKATGGKTLEVTVPSYANTSCPLMSRPVKPDIFVESSHGKVWLCCKNCLAKAKKEADATYAKAYPTAKKVDNKTDPVSGKPVKDGVTAVYQGYEINLADAANAKAVVANGDIYVTLLTKPNVKDVNNTKDPITDKPVADNLSVLVGDSLVRLSSAESVDAIKKDPAKAVEKAQKSAKKA